MSLEQEQRRLDLSKQYFNHSVFLHHVYNKFNERKEAVSESQSSSGAKDSDASSLSSESTKEQCPLLLFNYEPGNTNHVHPCK